MRLVFMVEERSMKELLEILLPKILPESMEKSLVIPHCGKPDLKKSLPIKLREWQNPSERFMVVCDLDSNDCLKLKADLLSLCKHSKNDFLIRIVCDEIESWYLGDLAAVSLAYEKDYTALAAKRKFREPDKLKNAKQELSKMIPTYQPIDGAKRISVHMDLENNTSTSFNTFVSGVKKMCCL